MASVVRSIERLPFGGYVEDPSWSPDGRTILYSSSSKIWRIDSNGGNLICLGDGSCPTWSPDGSKIAFVTDNGLEVMNADGNEREMLVNKAETVASTLLSDAGLDSTTWSPDGAMIAFQVYADMSDEWGQIINEIADIWVVNADGSNLRQLTTDPARVWNIVWSPNSQVIAFTSDRSGRWDIWVIHFDGTGLQQLTTNTWTDWNPSWSPDGSRIAFSSTESEEDDPEIWIMDADGGNKIKLITGSESYDNPSWSPDGSKIAFDSTIVGPIGNIWIVELAENEKTKLTDSSTTWFTCQQKLDWFEEPKWSPDGSKLLFLCRIREGNTIRNDGVRMLEFKQEYNNSS